MLVRSVSVADLALAELRTAILHGRFRPGTKLVVRPLAEELGLSPTPVKTALVALEKEGLIRAVVNRGYFVETFDEEMVKSLCAVRGAMDRLAAELAAGRPDHVAIAASLERNLEAQRRAVEVQNTNEYADRNHEFHRMISDGSGNQRVANISNSIASQVRLLVNVSARVPGRPNESVEEHTAIMRAIASGDIASAGAHALAHALKSEGALLEVLLESSAGTSEVLMDRSTQ